MSKFKTKEEDGADLIIPPKLTNELKNILIVNDTIIKSINSQRARLYDRLNKSLDAVQDEMELPSSKYLDWVKVVSPFVDLVVDNRVLDYELIKKYESFLKEVINHEKEYLISQEYINQVNQNTSMVLDSLLRLEGKVDKIKQDANNIILELHVRLMKKHAKLNDNHRYVPSCCVYCGKRLYKDDGDGEDTCINCDKVPKKYTKDIKIDIPDWYYEGKRSETNQTELDEPFRSDKIKEEISYKRGTKKTPEQKELSLSQGNIPDDSEDNDADDISDDNNDVDEQVKQDDGSGSSKYLDDDKPPDAPKQPDKVDSDGEKIANLIQTAFPNSQKMKNFSNKMKEEIDNKK